MIGRSLHWDEAWGKFSTAEWIGSGIFGAVAAAFALVGPLGDTPWTGGLGGAEGVDEKVRDALRAKSLEARFRARDISDVMLSSIVAYPFIDALLVAGWLRRSPEVAQQMALIDMQVYAVTLGTLSVFKSIGHRERPYGRICGDERPDDARDCDSRDRYFSFFSGHTAMSFAAASVNCSHHIHLGLYGSKAADVLSCVTGFAVASGTGVMRMVGDQHYFSDVVIGAAVGTVIGFGLPWLLHYRHQPQKAQDVPPRAASLQIVPMGLGAGLVGQF
ncbi:MAG: phosphatase PAP2 family protein [Deltaproteobacteria bacterium]|nr:phosphatase PAP2 family protein [Deltaproteobacteria bacterium]